MSISMSRFSGSTRSFNSGSSLWGTDPQAWAELAEAHNRPLFEAVLDAAAAGPGTAVLDVGCGSGLTLVLAAERGAVTSGVDISPGLLAIARDRLPRTDLREAGPAARARPLPGPRDRRRHLAEHLQLGSRPPLSPT
jgi:SAM-dependent methyltransferase